MIRGSVIVAFGIAVVGRLAVAQSTSAPLPTGVTSATIAAGKQVFEGTGLCAACHGPEGKGAIGPDLTDATWLHGKGTLTELVALIDTGVPSEDSKSGTPMPARGGAGLSDDEVKAVAAYVWSLSHSKGNGTNGRQNRRE